jgi:Fur family ferric uptake transcriptional regulator
MRPSEGRLRPVELCPQATTPNVEELYRRCAAIDEHISISTVYRTVTLFEDAGIIERNDFRDGRARYEQMPDTHHDHLINLRTGPVRGDRAPAGRSRAAARLPAGRP